MNFSPVEGQPLWENLEARRLHENGVAARESGHLTDAHDVLAWAIKIVASETNETENGDGLLQLAKITRDKGFTYIHEAIAKEDAPLPSLQNARQTLLLASDLTEPMVRGRNDELTFMSAGASFADSSDAMQRQLRAEVYAEHGATLSLLGRLATVREVLLEIDTRGDDPQAYTERKVEQRDYGRAHKFLRHGSNGYYRVMHALAGARQEVINGQHLYVGPWLGRVAAGLTWTLEYDFPNYKAAKQAFTGIMPHLRSYEAARESVLAKP